MKRWLKERRGLKSSDIEKMEANGMDGKMLMDVKALKEWLEHKDVGLSVKIQKLVLEEVEKLKEESDRCKAGLILILILKLQD